MKFNDLPEELQQDVRHMVEFCLNNGYCMGMDEGWLFDDEGCNISGPKPERVLLTKFAEGKE